MTENKRFRAMIDTVFNCTEVYDTENNNKMICMCRLHDKDDIIGLLNELHDENQALKERRHEDINDLSVIAMKYKALEEENKELKKKLKKKEKLIEAFEQYINDLREVGVLND